LARLLKALQIKTNIRDSIQQIGMEIGKQRTHANLHKINNSLPVKLDGTKWKKYIFGKHAPLLYNLQFIYRCSDVHTHYRYATRISIGSINIIGNHRILTPRAK
jgi:hypothetical protein